MAELTEDNIPNILDALEGAPDDATRNKALRIALKRTGGTSTNRAILNQAFRIYDRFRSLPEARRTALGGSSRAALAAAQEGMEEIRSDPQGAANVPEHIQALRRANALAFEANPKLFKGDAADRFTRFLRVQDLGSDEEVRSVIRKPPEAGNVVQEAGSAAATGAIETVSGIPGLGFLAPGTRDVQRLEAASEKFGPQTIGISRMVGSQVPFILGANKIAHGFAALGAGPVRAGVAGGAITGALVTPGGLGSRSAGGAMAGATLGVAAGLNKALRPVIEGFQLRALGAGLTPNLARRVTARAIPFISRTALDTGAFTIIGAGEEMFHGRDPQIGQLTVANLAVVMAANLMGARGKLGGKARAESQRMSEVLREGFAGTPGLLGKATARARVKQAVPDFVAVEVAYRAALRGSELSPAETRALLRSPEALRNFLAPEKTIVTREGVRTERGGNADRARDLFARDADRIAPPKFKEPNKFRQPEFIVDESAPIDNIARVLPLDSKGASILERGRVREVMETLDALADIHGVPHPEQKFEMPDASSREGLRQLSETVGRLPASVTSSGRNLAAMNSDDPLELRAPIPVIGEFRQIGPSFTRMFGDKLGRTIAGMFHKAGAKEARMEHLFRKRIAKLSGEHKEWAESLTEAEWQAAQRKIISLKEGGERTGDNPIETEFLNTVHQVMGRFRRMARARGFKVRGDEYFPHIFETVRVDGPASAQEIAARWLKPARGKPGSPGGFLSQRRTSRTDFSNDLFQVMNAYINTVTRRVYWEPVRDFVGKELPKLFEQDLARSVTDARKRGENLGINEIKDRQKVFSRIQERMDKQIRAAAGSHESVWADFGDGILRGVTGRNPKANPRNVSPTRNILNSWVYLNYVGALGLPNLASPLKNLTQQSNIVAEIGPTWWAKGLANMWVIDNSGKVPKLRLHPLIRRSGILGEGFFRGIERDIRSSFGGRTTARVKAVGDTLLSVFSGAETMNRSVSYLGSYLKARSRGLTEKEAGAFATQKTAQTQFNYGQGQGGVAYSGPFKHAIFQFQRFSHYQTDYLGSVMRRAMTGDTSGMLPGDLAIAPALRFAAATYAVNWGLSQLGVDLSGDLGAGGLPEPVKLVGQRAIEGVFREAERARSGAGLVGQQRGTEFARSIGLDPFNDNMGDSVWASMGPAAQAVPTMFDIWFGTPKDKDRARATLWSKMRTAVPGGIGVERFVKLQRELEEGQIRSSTSGDVMFSVEPHEAFMRMFGIQVPRIVDQYQLIGDTRRRQAENQSANSTLIRHTRDMYRQLLASKDPLAVPKAFAEYNKGLKAIFENNGVMSNLTFDEVKRRFTQNVIKGVDEREDPAIGRIDDRFQIDRKALK